MNGKFPVAELNSVLSRIEQIELRNLTWGAVDGSFSRDQLMSILTDLSEHGQDVSELFDELLGRQLIMKMGGVPPRYRSRFAETIRLLLRLRQMFVGQDWRDGRRLIADARIVHRQRRFPVRNIDADEVIEKIHEIVEISEFHATLCRLMIGSRQLSDFQAESCRVILQSVEGRKDYGLVISAGTGGGKTLAFYLPVLTWVGSQEDHAEPWVKALAIYPRNELLKDQLTETFRACRELDQVLFEKGRDAISLGAFFGPVPNSSSEFQNSFKGTKPKWERNAKGWECPFLRCPESACESSMNWSESDVKNSLEVLTCSQCGYRTPEDSIRLTRDSVIASPPDLLFTTSEMMNQRLSDAKSKHIFGVGSRPPRFVLLDEIHTYGGVTGAQTALLLRRWKQLVRDSVVFVGLSATLKEPRRFFSELTGLNETDVYPVTAMNFSENGSAEYLVALRNDPATMTGPLSATIQSLMLIRRMLDVDGLPSGGIFGERVFAFTDRLDSINRLYDDLRDAEGIDDWGRPVTRSPRSLATLRAPFRDDRDQRDLAGQLWDVEALGHRINHDECLAIGRTTSHDTGVESGTDVVVATGSLEVGFNDPTVGAVLQHKSPRTTAQFIQRKGRAGRSEIMRPFTLLVLSDFARDRMNYQSYEQLFDPVLDVLTLPVRNRYVLKIQATYALLDWISMEHYRRTGHRVWMWQLLSGPTQREWERKRQKEVVAILDEVLIGNRTRQILGRHLRESLALSESECDAILWEAPRSLLLHVIPTLRNRLEAWVNGEVSDGPTVPWHPLPDFVPRATFNQLLTPDVQVIAPTLKRGAEEKIDGLGVLQFLREFTPGNVSRRYGLSSGVDSHWVPIQGVDQVQVDIEEFDLEGEWVGTFQSVVDGTITSFEVLRPHRWKLANTPKNLKNSSKALPVWGSEMIPVNGIVMHLPSAKWVSNLFSEMSGYCQVDGSYIEVRRFVRKSKGTKLWNDGRQENFSATYFSPGIKNVGIGFNFEADGLKFVAPNPTFDHLNNGEVGRSISGSLFQELLSSDDRLESFSDFDRNWLRIILLGVLSGKSLKGDLKSRWTSLDRPIFQVEFCRSAEAVLGGSDPKNPPALLGKVLEWFQGEEGERLFQIIDDIVRNRYTDPSIRDRHLLSRYRATLAGALVEAITRLLPTVDADDLVVDLGPVHFSSDEFSEDVIWITESTPGGTGVIEAFTEAYSIDRSKFWNLFRASLKPTDLELLDESLFQIFEELDSSSPLRENFKNVREAIGEGVVELESAVRSLISTLEHSGYRMSHSLVTSLTSRILAPGTTSDHDSLRLLMRREWKDLEEEMGIEIDVRSLVCRWSDNTDLDALFGTAQLSPGNRSGLLQSLLWPKGGVIRSLSLGYPSHFEESGLPDRCLVRLDEEFVEIRSPKLDEVHDQLLKHSRIRVTFQTDQRSEAKSLMQELSVRPMDTGYMNLYPRISSLEVAKDVITIVVELPEVLL